MKKFFRVALVCALAGATLLYTGCTKDYSEDLNSLQKQVETQGNTILDQGKTIDQILQAIDGLKDADSLAQKQIDSLKARADAVDKEIDSLKAHRERLDSLISKNAGDITDLQDSLKQVDIQIDSLQKAATTLRSDVDTLKARVDAHDNMLDTLRKDVDKKADKEYVDNELDKKADKSWVESTYATVQRLLDTAAALRADLMYVAKDVDTLKSQVADLTDGFGKLGERLNKVADSVKMNADAIALINETINNKILPDLDTLQKQMSQVIPDLKEAKRVADSAAKLAGEAYQYAKDVEDYLLQNYYTIKTVDALLARKADLKYVDSALATKVNLDEWIADTAEVHKKLREIDSTILQVIHDYQEADSLLNDRCDTLAKLIKDLRDEYEEFVKAVNAHFDKVDLAIDKLMARVQSIVYLPEYDDDRITLNWAQMYAQNMFDTRDPSCQPLPPSFSEEWKEFLADLYGDVPAELEPLLNDLIDDMILPGDDDDDDDDDYSNGIPFFGRFGMIDGVTIGNSFDYFGTPIVEPTHVKYRIYGNDPASIVSRLVDAVNEGQDLLSFDVIRVGTRVNKDNVALNITHAEVDDLFTDGSVIDLTVVPEGLPDCFWLYTWDVKNFMNPRTHYLFFFVSMFLNNDMPEELFNWLYKQYVDCGGVIDFSRVLRAENEGTTEPGAQLEEDTEFPAFSVSLVLQDVSDTTDRMITSAYNNVVPAAKSDRIDLWIRRDGDDITNRGKDHPKGYADTTEIPYTSLQKDTILTNTELMLTFKGKDYTAEEFAALGMNLGEPQARFFEYKDYSGSIAAKKGETLDPDYITNTADDDIPEAYVQLKEVDPDGVGALEVVELYYFYGPGVCWTSELVLVTPEKITLEVDIVENADLVPITWNYKDDAPVDASIFNGNTNLAYNRDSALAAYDEDEVAEKLAGAGITPEDFSTKVPVDEKTTFTFYYTDEEGNVQTVEMTLAELKEAQEAADEDTPVFNIYPYFTEDGVLMARLENFWFNDVELGALDSIKYTAVYNLPDDEQPAIEVTVNGKILFDDRDRTPIVITLPTTVEDYFLNFQFLAKDSLYLNGELNATVETSFADHHLTPEDVQDAFGKVEAKSWTGLNDPPYAGGEASTNVLYGKNFIWDHQGEGMEGGYVYEENERIDSMTTTTRPIYATTDFETVTAVVRNNTTAHINTVFDAADDARVIFNTFCNFNSRDLRNKEIIPNVDYAFYLTLWYGQDVIVKKSFRINTDGIFDFERIADYVGYNTDEDVYTTLQPKWTPKEATKDYSIPVEKYEASDVLLNQHFRVVDVKNKVVCTDAKGVLSEDYSYIRRRFWLENKNEETGAYDVKVIRIEDPRKEGENKYPDWSLTDPVWAQPWAVTVDNELDADTEPNQEANVVAYLSEAPFTNVYGNLYIMNENGSFIRLTTRFDRPAGDLTQVDPAHPVETYENYVIKLYDPLRELTVKNDDPKQIINMNNSMIEAVSIYEFLSLKDKRDWELIDGDGWVVGTGTNGFVAGKSVADVFDLHFSHSIEFISQVAPETMARIHFDQATGILSFDSDFETQLARPIDVELKINVEYPWGTRSATVVLEFVNIPVGEQQNP